MRSSAPLIVSIFLLLFLFEPVFAQDNKARIQAETRKTASGRQYLLIQAESVLADFKTERPSRKNAGILLCIPAAFTDPYGGICGLYACRGAVGNENRVDRGMGGAIEMNGSGCRILDTRGGADLNGAFIEELRSKNASFFQQFQIVKNGQAEGFRDKSRSQRRCLATTPSGKLLVVESNNDVSFAEFGCDLVELGVRDAIYTDMGPWSEGWYRDGKGDTVTIGNSRAMTHKQSNWVVFSERGKQ